MTVEQRVAEHYTQGGLAGTILGALRAMGKDPERLAPADLAPVDEFHIGGRQATIDFAAQMGIRPGMRLLDIGSGLGGAARYFAGEHGCSVTGIDLTDEYVQVASDLARRAGLDGSVSYRQGSALDLPFDAASFDGAYMLHVGMNIEDKARLFAGVRRVLKPGGLLGVYDVMRTGAGDFSFPVPWAATAATSFVETPTDYRQRLEAAGFAVQKERGRRDFALAFFQQMRARAAQSGGPPPLGLHILMGADFAQKTANMIDNLQRGLIEPTEIVSQAA
ncbi:class I SAM-dependent methyltransferase [Vineibacter terrae]|uniref:class I SAM-dependent methyltransferase n=1 Tax=Vineibacter terrae TaxID=2586908 RepID=UPI002E30CEBF|nr:class I SAM-dependent methyltransferase [Vineibacter terrae]HEX2891147.1 class I SAM-dependent methyltransferase [Vineibacter terrae]